MKASKCYFHPVLEATHTDTVVDLANSGQFDMAYKRVSICSACAIERGQVNTSRVEPIIHQ